MSVERQSIAARPDFPAKLEAIGLSFHSWDNYWKEDACYRFSAAQVDELEAVTEELHRICLIAVEHVVNTRGFARLGIPEAFWEAISASWHKREPSLYGRFDLAYDGSNTPKMLEYNADTPTSLLESAVAQWYWMEECFPGADQFNSLHERLVARWRELDLPRQSLHIASIGDNEEDWVCTHYLVDTALQAGLQARHIYLEDIGWDAGHGQFVDLEDEKIDALFKLYPWEWMMRESFGENIPGCQTRFIEPLWKSLLACKGILAVLWELFPGHPNLLPAYFSPSGMRSYARKPLFSREGANVELVRDGHRVHFDGGPYGAEGFVYQSLVEMKAFAGKYPVIGAWVVGDEAAGICVREDTTPVTTNLSNFVPHYFE